MNDTTEPAAPVTTPPALSYHHPDDEHVRRRVGRIEIIISTLLRIGVFSSLAIIVLGLIITYSRNPQYATHADQLPKLTAYGAVFPHSLNDVFGGVARLRGQSLIALGLLILIATPVMRVAISIIAFVIQRDYVFVAITSVVLTLLVFSFLMGHFSH
jgi:uncharacterized membrane protein